MTTWTIEQVRNVKGLRVTAALSQEQLARGYIDVQLATNERMAKQLIEAARTFGVEVNPADTEVRWSRDDEEPWVERGTLRWGPATREVELRGGHHDGLRLQVDTVGTVILMATPREVDWEATEPTEVLAPHVDQYHLDGWREDERVWVYSTRTT